jgi:hypothetical protein
VTHSEDVCLVTCQADRLVEAAELAPMSSITYTAAAFLSACRDFCHVISNTVKNMITYVVQRILSVPVTFCYIVQFQFLLFHNCRDRNSYVITVCLGTVS